MTNGEEIWQRKQRRAFLISQLYQWHWISSGMCLIGMILFALTGITLNHAGQIEARPSTVARDGQLPPEITANLNIHTVSAKERLPEQVTSWLRREMGIDVVGHDTEWSANDIYVALPRPGGDAWLNIERVSGTVTYEVTDRGWIAYLNDLHKGRHTGAAWSWFLDLFAAAAVVFCLTGLLLLQLHAKRRPATWPVVGLGFIIPMLLLILFTHP
jgi:uncharacterized protein